MKGDTTESLNPICDTTVLEGRVRLVSNTNVSVTSFAPSLGGRRTIRCPGVPVNMRGKTQSETWKRIFSSDTHR